jgi:hypothetical protein
VSDWKVEVRSQRSRGEQSGRAFCGGTGDNKKGEKEEKEKEEKRGGRKGENREAHILRSTKK